MRANIAAPAAAADKNRRRVTMVDLLLYVVASSFEEPENQSSPRDA
jgi:hypothetical protein